MPRCRPSTWAGRGIEMKRSHAMTELGPMSVPRWGSDCAAPPCTRGSLRCSRPKGGCSTARRGAERATTAGPALLCRTSPCVAALLASPDSPQRATDPEPARRLWCSTRNASGVLLAKPGSGVRRQRHEAALRSAGPRWACASARASSSDSPRLFERSERSERSEFRGATSDRAPQGSRPAGPTAASERRRIPGCGFASLGLRTCARSAMDH